MVKANLIDHTFVEAHVEKALSVQSVKPSSPAVADSTRHQTLINGCCEDKMNRLQRLKTFCEESSNAALKERFATAEKIWLGNRAAFGWIDQITAMRKRARLVQKDQEYLDKLEGRLNRHLTKAGLVILYNENASEINRLVDEGRL